MNFSDDKRAVSSLVVNGKALVGKTLPPFTFAPNFPTNQPSYAASVHLGLTAAFITVFGLIFIGVYLQLILILYYRHKRFSYQTGFLFLCLLWSLLRITLFSFYFHNATEANILAYPLYFLLYCFPSCLQFAIICLLVLFFGELYFKVARRFTMRVNNLRLLVFVIAANVIFLGTSIGLSYVLREACSLHRTIEKCNTTHLTRARVFVTDSLFVIFGIMLGVYLFRLARMPNCNTIFKQHGTSRGQAIIVTVFTSFLFFTRTVYNVLSISVGKFEKMFPDFGNDWINVSDQADLVDFRDYYKYLAFSTVLLIWEVLPTLAVVIVFRIKRNEITNSSINSDARERRFVVSKSVFTDTQASAAVNYSYDRDAQDHATAEERASLLYASYGSDASSNYYESYSSTARIVTPLNFSNENYKSSIEPPMNFSNENYKSATKTEAPMNFVNENYKINSEQEDSAVLNFVNENYKFN